MTDWKTFKGQGPWPFVKQYNKWAYLNNPRWQVNGRPFVPGGPDDYDGRESEEPQVWTPPGTPPVYSKGTTVQHHQCGHWHVPQPLPVTTAPTTLAPTTAAPVEYIPWLSCPIAIITVMDGVWYITTDDGYPTDVFFIWHWYAVGPTSGITYQNSIDVTDMNWNQWIEPDIGIARQGTTRVVTLVRGYPEHGDSYGLDIYVMSGENLQNHTIINGYIGQTFGSFSVGNGQACWNLVDDLGNIHIIAKTYIGFDFKLRDFISTDGGATFSNVIIGNTIISDTQLRFIKQLSSGTIYVFNISDLYTSNNHGSTWSAATPIGFTFHYIEVLNDVFFGFTKNGADVILKRSVNGTVWADVCTLNAGNATHFAGAAACYDGSTYFVASMYRDSAVAQSAGYTYIHSSPDGINWTLIATIVDEANLAVPTGMNLHPTFLSEENGIMYFTFYYAEMESLTMEDVYFMSFWKSTDNGVTWEVVNTPFYDMTRPGAVPPH